MKTEFTDEQMTAIAEICNRDFRNHYAISQDKNDKEEETQILVLETNWIFDFTLKDLLKTVKYISINPVNNTTIEIHLYQ